MKSPMNVVILGGGSAGWMAASLMTQAWVNKHVHIQLIESPEIGIIGVGEGSTPQLKTVFEKLGISERRWMRQCNATYKHGIEFTGWSGTKGFESYFHSFPAKTDRDTAQAFVYNCFLRRQQLDVSVNPSSYFLPAWLAKYKLGPHPDDNFPFNTSYGYHFDAHQLGNVLRDHAVQHGVQHVRDHISEIKLNEKGDIESLIGKEGKRYDADFFIDASGFQSVLLQQALGVEFESYSDSLFNDSAVVMASELSGGPNAHTQASAMRCGWRWNIPLQHRIGNGYVYSSAFCSREQAEHELRAELGLLEQGASARHLKMKVGQVKEHWHKNCLAVGLSQGFLEPLEATALHLVQSTIETFINAFNFQAPEQSQQAAFNQQIHARFNGIKDYIVCHYKMNSRTDTEYWKANRDNPHISDSLASLLQVWHLGGDLSLEIDRQQISHYYSTLSWHALLAGYGAFNEKNQHNLIKHDRRAQRFSIEEVENFNQRCALNFTKHAAQIGFSSPGKQAI